MDVSPHILLVDDNRRFAESLQQILRIQNYPSTIAFSGEEALELSEKTPFDLVLLDVDLPGMSGVETLDLIKKLCPTMPVIMITGNTTVETAVAAMKKGAYDYLKKPIVHDLLKATISKAIGHSRLEKELNDSEERFKTLTEASWEGVIIHNNGLIIEGNQQFFDMFGYTKEELLRTHILERIFNRDSLVQIQNRIENGVIGSHEATGVRKDRSEFPLETRSRYIKFQGQNLRVCAIRDITERKKAEQENLNLQMQLAKASKMEALGLMAGSVAHDLNNILAGIVSFPEILLMEMDKTNKHRESVKIIQKAGRRAASVVSDLITIARGTTTPKIVKNPNSIISDYLSSIEHKEYVGKSLGITVLSDLDGDLLNIRCSEVQLSKVLMNLVGNAIEALDDQGFIVITTENVHLAEPVAAYEKIDAGDYIKITVSDTGPGIQEQDIDHIFEPFYSRKIMGRSGTGLGLAIVWSTVHDHRGFINVKSGDEGTSFEILLPSTDEKEICDFPALSLNALKGNGEAILVVDDQETQCLTTRNLLTNIGYHAFTVTSGEEAVKICSETPMDLVILDMILEQGMNGRETYEEMLKINPQQKAIVISGFSENEELVKIQELGVSHFIRKPYTLDQLGIAVKQSLLAVPTEL
ncbi:MAG: response regulator [Deltaproteobacteria bacterium]|nr:response regulator [Deltaproteobacteria bacterium]MBW2658070.1 response regulator [Deltaproteobacteria bacterium]